MKETVTAPSATSSGSPGSLAGAAPRRDVVRRGLAILWLAVREQPRVFTISVLGSGLYALMTVASALVLGQVTESVIVPQLRDGDARGGALAAAALAIIGVAIFKAIGIVGRRLWAGVMQYSLQAEYRRRVTRQYLRLPLSWHASHPTGELLSNANADVEATWYPIAPFPFAVGVLLMLAVTIVLLLLTDPILALIGLLIFPAVAIINVFYSRRLSPLMTRAQQLRGDVSGVAHESFDGALVVKTLGREDSETVRFAGGADELRDAMIRVGRVRGTFDPIMEALPNIGVLLVLLIGASRLDSGAINVGQLVRVAYLFTLLAFPIRAIGWVLGELPRSVVGYDRVERVLSATGAQQHGDAQLSSDSGPASPALIDVTFSYQGSEPVLHDVSFAVRPGSTLALVGPTGSGKSTLASLLVRLLDPVSGEIRLDDVDLRRLAAGQVPAAAALVPQQTFLFDDTVRGNVALGLPVSDDEVWAALAVAQADGFIAALPRGLDTEIGERGASLSGGQRQRLALARALVRRPRLLVLDDATSSVDPHVEAAILAGLRTADLASTVIVVAYRKATIALADEVLYIEQGRVLGRGTHAELLTTSPGYARLVTAYERAEAERVAERAAQSEPEPVS
jgi:ABC-type multidrug transport system fused ATPase/permease subunit